MAADLLLSEAPPPEDVSDSDSLYEVVNGERVEQPEMSIQANLIAFRLATRLSDDVDRSQFGTVTMEALVILDAEANLRRRPDVCFVSAERWPLDREVPETGDWEVVPDLAIEVISPNDTVENLFTKLDEYFDCGVRQVWLVLPERREVYVYDSPTDVRKLGGEAVLTGGEIIPGFEIALPSLFRRAGELRRR
jgi:Uma2 family endonuclease